MTCPNCGCDTTKRKPTHVTITQLDEHVVNPAGVPRTYKIAGTTYSGSRGTEAKCMGADGLIHRVCFYDPERCFDGTVVKCSGSLMEFHRNQDGRKLEVIERPEKLDRFQEKEPRCW